jgi:hypothetical protein
MDLIMITAVNRRIVSPSEAATGNIVATMLAYKDEVADSDVA